MKALYAAFIFSVALFASVACEDTSKHTQPTSTAQLDSPTMSGCDDPVAPDSNQPSGGAMPLLAYTAVTADGDAVWTVEPDGSKLSKIADNALQASWSPDGRTIVAKAPKPSGALLVTEVTTGRQTTVDAHLEQSRSSDLSWDPTGARFAYSRLRPGDDTFRNLWVADTAGNAKIALEYADPIGWSPDGRWIAYRAESPSPDPTSFSPPQQLAEGPTPGSLGGPLRLLDIASGATKQISGDGWIPYGVGMQIWSPDSRFIAYWRSFPGNGDSSAGELYAADIESGKQIAVGSFTYDTFPTWAGNGKRDIISNREIDPARDDIATLFPAPEAVLAWSIDGRIAVVVEPSPNGGRDLVVRDVPSGTRRVIQHSDVAITPDLEPGYRAVLREDGRYLAYYGITRSFEAGGDTIPDEHTALVVMDLTSGASTIVQDPVDFRPGVVAFSPDGQWLSVQRGGHPESICVSHADGSNPRHLADGITLGTFDYPDPWGGNAP